MKGENTDVRIVFAATASAYRRRAFQLTVVFAASFVVFVVAFYSGSPGIAALTFLALVTAFIIEKRTLPKLICPACKLDFDCEPVRFCPECGSSKLRKKGDDNDAKYFLTWPRCQECSKELSTGKGGRRQYEIRFCTRCGAYLDEEGL